MVQEIRSAVSLLATLAAILRFVLSERLVTSAAMLAGVRMENRVPVPNEVPAGLVNFPVLGRRYAREVADGVVERVVVHVVNAHAFWHRAVISLPHLDVKRANPVGLVPCMRPKVSTQVLVL